jgi:hypothetical protein
LRFSRFYVDARFPSFYLFVAHRRKLLAFLHARDEAHGKRRLADIGAFLIECRKQYARATAADMACSVRSFMRFMLLSGRMTVDLAPSIVRPIVRCPGGGECRCDRRRQRPQVLRHAACGSTTALS